MQTEDSITSLDVYLKYPAKSIIRTQKLVDVGCGYYRCFYLIDDNCLKVSTSVLELIRESNKFVLNKNFNPDFLQTEFDRRVNITHDIHETIDERIFKLCHFETRTLGSSSSTSSRGFLVSSREELITKSIWFFTEFVHKIETQYPEFHHVVLTSGRDSQLIHLVPKINKRKWSVCTAEPSVSLVKQWFADNNVYYRHFFARDIEDESYNKEFEITKAFESSLFATGEHTKHLAMMLPIVKMFNGKCFFWQGSMSDGAHFYVHDRWKSHKTTEAFLRSHIIESSGTANDRNIVFNITGCPTLSIYTSEEIWRDFYFNLDLLRLCLKGEDLREEIGNRMAGHKIRWIDEASNYKPYTRELTKELRASLKERYVSVIYRTLNK